MKSTIKHILCVLLACTICALIFCAFLMVGHDCEGTNCYVCETIDNVFCLFSAAMTLVLFLTISGIGQARHHTPFISRYRHPVTSLFRMKTQLLD